MTEHEYQENWNTRKIIEETMKSFHSEPSPETRERLKALETQQKFMVDEISEIKQLVKGLDTKLDNVIQNKADKEEVKTLWKKMDNLVVWKAYMMGIGAVILFILYLLKDYLMHKI